MEMWERAVRLVSEHEGEYPSQWAAITSIAAKCGMTPETPAQVGAAATDVVKANLETACGETQTLSRHPGRG